jgi:flagellar motility protein MotE (MotC chaperone)
LKQIRLLPIVIVAALALLVLKGIGIMTGGGYVLTGMSVVEAAGGKEGSGEGNADATITLPSAPTLKDAVPTLDDGAPTLRFDAPGDGKAEGHGGTPPAIADVLRGEPDGRSPEGGTSTVPVVCEEAPASASALANGFDLEDNCLPMVGVNEHGDALPLTTDGAGNLMPLEASSGPGSEGAILERLAERRNALDTRESELEMRLALVEAAEKRIEERTASLQALEARINAMVDEKRALEEKQFVAVVAMYELMKPKDAAAIFDQLELDVLLRVARSMSPRKMAPILSKMDPRKAKDLTAGMAVDRVEATIDLGGENLAALPQIVGH